MFSNLFAPCKIIIVIIVKERWDGYSSIQVRWWMLSPPPPPIFFRWGQSHATRGGEEEDCRVPDACRTDIKSASKKQHGSRVNTDSGEWDGNVSGPYAVYVRLCKSSVYPCIHQGLLTTWGNVLRVLWAYHRFQKNHRKSLLKNVNPIFPNSHV